MAANLTIYCLENVTDYFEFERLCHDLMALQGYSSIEPLGGFSDRGRDAVHINKSGETTIFAYSVREDWRAKIAEDAAKIQKHGHDCDRLVFITTSRISAGERDEAVAYIRDDFGWALDLFSVERLRVLLDATHPTVKEHHPQIFPPDFLRLHSTFIHGSTERNHLFISYSPEDGQFAEWLARRLTAEGYLVWCERIKTFGNESYPDDVDSAIRNRTSRVLALYSRASLRNPEVMRHRTFALSLANDGLRDFVIPLNVDGVRLDQLDRITRALSFIQFEHDWSSGLRELLQKLESVRCPKPLPDGRGVAAEAFGDRDLLTGQSETLYSNCLLIEKIPDVVVRFKTRKAVPNDRLDTLQHEWAYRAIDPMRFLSFHQPPDSFVSEFQVELKGGECWSDVETIDGIRSRDLVIELLRKSLVVKCHDKGLLFCPETFLHYFPMGLLERERLYFIRPDGSRTFINATGQRKFWRPTGSEEYKYYLAPVFSVSQGLFDSFTVLVRVRIRLTDLEGVVLPKHKGVSRRKHLCMGWWNNDWLNRMLAVSQHLAENTKIIIGALPKEQIIISAVPVSLSASEGINEGALDRLSFERSELLAALEESETDDDADARAVSDE